MSGVSDQVRHKPACSASKGSQSPEICGIETRGIVPSRKLNNKGAA